jgi:glycosyltransferase involved in cell wall biosynthesis
VSKIRVCHITSVHQAKDNRIFYKECVSLVNDGYDVSLLVINGKTEVCEGVNIIGINHQGKGRVFRFLGATRKLYRESKILNADIYHFHDPELMFAGLKLKWFRGKKVIYDIHEILPASVLSKPYIRYRFIARCISIMAGLVERLCSGRYSALVTARPDIARRFKAKNPVIVRNFPILRVETSDTGAYKKNDKAIIYVGGITRIRGLVELVRAFKYVDDGELWLLGPFEDEEIKRECQKLEAWNKVKYLGVVAANEVIKYIRQAAAGIITFLPYPNHITSLPTKPFEYMYGGLPIIMSDFMYWRDFFGDSAVYVNPSDPKEIASAVNEMLADKTKRERMGNYNYNLIRDSFNWDIEKQKLLDLYKKLVV